MICLTRMLFIHEMPQLLEILMTRTSMTPRNMEKIWREVEEKFRMKPVLITWIIQFMFLTYHSYNHLLYLQIMDHQCLHYDLTLKLKTVANLTNNKDVFMCILRYHARAGYLQTYETLLKEINSHPGSAPVAPDQYEVECAALADRNFNVPCETGIRYPSLLAMINRQDMLWRPSVILSNIMIYTLTFIVYTFIYCLYLHIHGTYSDYQLMIRQATETRRVCAP